MEILLDWMQRFGIPMVLLLIFLEYACFPLPSEVVLPFAGAVAAMNGTNFVVLYLASVLAGLGGCFVCYAIGRFGGRKAVDWITRRFPRTKKGLDASERQFRKYANAAVGFGRLVPLCRTYISLIAGMSGQPPLSFAGFSLLGILVWNFVLTILGYLLGDNWQLVTEIYDQYKLPILLAAVVLVGGFVAWKFWRYRKSKNLPKSESGENPEKQ